MWGGEWGVLSGQVWEAEQVEHRGKSLGPECKVGCEVGRCVQKTSWQMSCPPSWTAAVVRELGGGQSLGFCDF